MVKKIVSLFMAFALMIGAGALLPKGLFSFIEASAKTTYYDTFTMNIDSSKWKDITKSISGVEASFYYIGDLSNSMYATANFNVIVEKNAGNFNVNDYAEIVLAQYKNAGYTVKSHKAVKLNGYNALKIESTMPQSGYTLNMGQYVLVTNNNCYIISYGSESSVYSKMKPELESVVSTFKPLTRKSIANAKVTLKSKYYTGKAIKQSPVVKLGKKTLKEGTDYTVSYKNNKNIGTATVTIKGKNAYKGSVKATFKICPKKTTLSKVTSPKTKQAKVTYSKVKGVTGYQISYSTSKSFTKKTTKTAGSKKTSKTITGLTKGKTYYVKVRTYKTVDGKKYYSGWSDVKKIKVK